MIEWKHGDLLQEKAEALVNPVNCVGVMGRGLALEFKKAFPKNFKAYEKACENGDVHLGQMFVFETGEANNPSFLINFPTKDHWRSKSRIEDIESGLEALIEVVRKYNIRSLAVPPLGCGLGGLEWSEVRPRIEEAFRPFSHVLVVVFQPQATPTREAPTHRQEAPTMTAGRAALVELAHRYLGGLLDPVITLLELHKLMYFMQEGGEVLRLDYKKAYYGPYAENLRHVLRRIEGHLISGYGDGGDAPNKPLELVPGAAKKAAAFLQAHPATRARVHQVAELVEGFESPFGLELLSTVHWILKNEPVDSFEDVIEHTYAWNDDKRQFTSRQIALAMEILARKGWVQPLKTRIAPPCHETKRTLSAFLFSLPTQGVFAMREVVIVSAVRTGIGGFQGGLSSFKATELGGLVIRESLRRSGIADADVSEIIFGNVLPHGLGQNPARQAFFYAGLPHEAGALTINKVCGSGLKAVMLAAQAIGCGDAEVVIAGGMESMSNAPYLLEKARTGLRMGHAEIVDAMIRDGLWDVRNDFHMGYTAELVAQKYNVSREEMDRFAFLSYEKALAADKAGLFDEEKMTVTIPSKKGDPIAFRADESLRPTELSALAKLKPAFQPDGGSVTAGNASKLSDGAAALVLTSRSFAEEKGLPILASVVAQASAGIELKDVLVAPICAIPKVLKKAKLTIADIDLFEINEAFAASSIAVAKTLGIPEEKTNPHGGSVALGHPIGASGARVLVTLLHALKHRSLRRGLATLCLGGGEAVALIVERRA